MKLMDKGYRLALVEADPETVEAYLPANYDVLTAIPAEGHTLIGGRDVAGWTLHDYVIPRLLSGLHPAVELLPDFG